MRVDGGDGDRRAPKVAPPAFLSDLKRLPLLQTPSRLGPCGRVDERR